MKFITFTFVLFTAIFVSSGFVAAETINITIDPPAVSFGAILLGSPANQPVAVRHDAPRKVACRALLAGASAALSVSPNNATIDSGATATFTVSVNATSPTQLSASLIITCGQNSRNVNITGSVVEAIKPDLSLVGEPGSIPQFAFQNGEATVTVDIRNQGPSPTRACKFSLLLDGSPVTGLVPGFDNFDVPPLGPFEDAASNSATKVIKFQTTLTGAHTLQVTVDSDNQNDEISENNNDASRSVTF